MIVGTKVKLRKTIRYGTRVFEKGETATLTDAINPFIFQGSPIYDYYIQLPHCKPIGVFKFEIEIIKETT